MTEHSGEFAVVTGASSGIGFELAKLLADEGFDVLINAEDTGVDTAAAELESSGGVVEAVKADLSKPEGVETLHAAIRARGRAVDILCLNAGVGAGGDFARDTDLDKELTLIDLNVRSTVHLAKLTLKDMVARDHGRILFTSSIASTMPGSFQAVYNASKSFVQSFALALRNELKDTEIVITSLMPGPTETEFFERADMLDTAVGAGDKDDPGDVAREGYEALMAGRERVVAGSVKNKVQAAVSGAIPDRVKAEMHRGMAEPESADED
jgi:uncharacterized protein